MAHPGGMAVLFSAEDGQSFVPAPVSEIHGDTTLSIQLSVSQNRGPRCIPFLPLTWHPPDGPFFFAEHGLPGPRNVRFHVSGQGSSYTWLVCFWFPAAGGFSSGHRCQLVPCVVRGLSAHAPAPKVEGPHQTRVFLGGSEGAGEMG